MKRYLIQIYLLKERNNLLRSYRITADTLAEADEEARSVTKEGETFILTEEV